MIRVSEGVRLFITNVCPNESGIRLLGQETSFSSKFWKIFCGFQYTLSYETGHYKCRHLILYLQISGILDPNDNTIMSIENNFE
jgi:hypothetical protein